MKVPETRPRRHDFVRLIPGTQSLLASNVSPEVIHWHRLHPFVVTRRCASSRADTLTLGLALPDKRRIAFEVGQGAVAERSAPPRLVDTIDSAPAHWRTRLREIVETARRFDTEVRAYGSLAWQHLTQLDYVHAASDVDLLLSADRWENARRLADELHRMDGIPRLDGELRLPDGSGVAWREIPAGAARALVKGDSFVVLMTRAEIRGLLESAR
ncbi:MAG: malonate decarboxylase holo-[acyl-carrier-protein] synthase [Steroidobacteraceae bacterium]